MSVAPATEVPAPPTHAVAGGYCARVAAPCVTTSVHEPAPMVSAPTAPALERRDVIRFLFCGRTETGTVIRAEAVCVWVRVGAATLRVPRENVLGKPRRASIAP